MKENIQNGKSTNEVAVSTNDTNPDKELTLSGWTRRTVTSEPRLSELVDLYASLDFDIHLEPVTFNLLKALKMDCGICFNGNLENYKVIYTRKHNRKE